MSSGETDALKRRLLRLQEATASAASADVGGWWVGDVAGERQVADNISAGRLSWRAAHRCAKAGLAALAEDNLEMAQTYAWEATDHFIAAVLSRLRPSDLAVLEKPAARRGRPAKK